MKKMHTTLVILVIASMLMAACAPAATPAPTQAPAPAEAPTQAPAPTEAMPAAAGPITFEPGQAAKLVLLPKFLGILVFDQANQGAEEAAAELQNPEKLQFLGPTPENSVAGQIEIVTNATTQGANGIMLSNNAGDQIAPAAKAARGACPTAPCVPAGGGSLSGRNRPGGRSSPPGSASRSSSNSRQPLISRIIAAPQRVQPVRKSTPSFHTLRRSIR